MLPRLEQRRDGSANTSSASTLIKEVILRKALGHGTRYSTVANAPRIWNSPVSSFSTSGSFSLIDAASFGCRSSILRLACHAAAASATTKTKRPTASPAEFAPAGHGSQPEMSVA